MAYCPHCSDADTVVEYAPPEPCWSCGRDDKGPMPGGPLHPHGGNGQRERTHWEDKYGHGPSLPPLEERT